MRLPVIVVVDCKGAQIVAAIGEIDYITILLPRGEREESEGLFLERMEVEWLGHKPSGTAGEEAVEEPSPVKLVDGIGGAAAVNVVRNVCSKQTTVSYS